MDLSPVWWVGFMVGVFATFAGSVTLVLLGVAVGNVLERHARRQKQVQP